MAAAITNPSSASRGRGLLLIFLAHLILLGVTLAHILFTPYTKIEEHFLLNAVHDVLSFGVIPPATDSLSLGEDGGASAWLGRFDFRKFPDPVPHSFLGVLALAAATYPGAVIGRWVGWIGTSADVQTLVRMTLGTSNVLSLIFFAHQVLPQLSPPRAKHNKTATICFVLLHIVQFHFLFWAGRTTHNSLVLGPTLIALALILRSAAGTSVQRQRPLLGIALLVFCGAVLRAELIGLLLPSCLWLLALRRVSVTQLIAVGFVTWIVAIDTTTLLDKPLWAGIHGSIRTPIWDTLLPSPIAQALHSFEKSIFWPELEALKFNVLEGKSADWGVMPWHFYLSSALPKLFSFSAPLVVLHLVRIATRRTGVSRSSDVVDAVFTDEKGDVHDKQSDDKLRTRQRTQIGLLAIVIGHIVLLSMLGHKEWRFIVYVVPCLNALAATEMASIFTSPSPARKSVDASKKLPLRLLAISALLLTALHTSIATAASHANYPGGVAMKTFHELMLAGEREGRQVTGGITVYVHTDVAATMTGVTRFQLLHLDRESLARLSKHNKERQSGGGAFGLDWLPSAFPSPPPTRLVWLYDRREVPDEDEARRLNGADLPWWLRFTHVIGDAPDGVWKWNAGTRIKHTDGTKRFFEVVPGSPSAGVRQFGGMRVRKPRDVLRAAKEILVQGKGRELGSRWTELVPLQLVMKDGLWILQRRGLAGLPEGDEGQD